MVNIMKRPKLTEGKIRILAMVGMMVVAYIVLIIGFNLVDGSN